MENLGDIKLSIVKFVIVEINNFFLFTYYI